MRKQLLALLLCLAALAGVSGPALAAGEAASAEPSVPQIYVDGALYEHASVCRKSPAKAGLFRLQEVK